jgi:hypothetical protein
MPPKGAIQGSLFSRMSPASSAPTMDETLLLFSGGFGNAGLLSPTESSMPSFSVFLSEGDEYSSSASSLSQVLETSESVPPKYYLSPRAAQGILRRAAKRGKELPETLRTALEALVSQARGGGETA